LSGLNAFECEIVGRGKNGEKKLISNHEVLQTVTFVIVSRKGVAGALLLKSGKNDTESMLNGNAVTSHAFVNRVHEM
jgi:hypothetical protein